jgi:hypothetical protein
VRQTLTISATLEQVRILDGQTELACHPRSFDQGQQIEQPEHIETLLAWKSKARKHRGQDQLAHAVPASQTLLSEAALRGEPLGSITSTLLRLLQQYGASELAIAIQEALDKGVPHPNAVRQALQRRREERDQPPPIPVPLPDDHRAQTLSVKTHALGDYDQLNGGNNESVNSNNEPVKKSSFNHWRK